MAEKSVVQMDFELRFSQAKPKVKDVYLDFLAEARKLGEQSSGGHTYFVPYSERESLLIQAEQTVFHGVNVRKMRRAWEKAGGDENPPIGGAQND